MVPLAPLAVAVALLLDAPLQRALGLRAAAG